VETEKIIHELKYENERHDELKRNLQRIKTFDSDLELEEFPSPTPIPFLDFNESL